MWPCSGEDPLEYCRRGNVVMKFILGVRRRQKWKEWSDGNVRKTRPAIAALENVTRPWTNRKHEMNSPLGPPEGRQTGWHLDFSSLGPIPDSWAPQLYDNKLVPF